MNGFSADLGRIVGVFTSLPLYPSSEIVKKSAVKKKILMRGGRHVGTRVDGVIFLQEKENHCIYHSINNNSINIYSPRIRLRVLLEGEKGRPKSKRLLLNVPLTTFVLSKFIQMIKDEIVHAIRTYKQRRNESHIVKLNSHANYNTLNEKEEKVYKVRDTSS